MSYLLVVTMLSMSLSAKVPIPVVDHTINERFGTFEECVGALSLHISLVLPGNIWAGTRPHPNGQFKQCEPG
jgi:hypothetical protein